MYYLPGNLGPGTYPYSLHMQIAYDYMPIEKTNARLACIAQHSDSLRIGYYVISRQGTLIRRRGYIS